jgi:tRNA1Val (adenine37-N6)-methyltransferase
MLKRYVMTIVQIGERIDDLDLKGLKIIQNPKWFCFGIDAVLLASFAVIKKKDKVIDLGTGTGIIPILVYGKYSPKEIIGIEIQKDVAEMAERSIHLNKLQDIIKIYNGDIKDSPSLLGVNGFDIVLSNPPYKKANTGLLNPEDTKAISRHEVLIKLDELVYSAARLLREGGKFYMIHRPERLKDIILSLDKNNFAPKRLRFIHSRAGDKPSMLLVEAVKSGGDFLKIEEPIYVYNEDGTYTDEILRMYGRERPCQE